MVGIAGFSPVPMLTEQETKGYRQRLSHIRERLLYLTR